MKKIRKKAIITFICIFIMTSILVIFGIVDCNRFKSGKTPIFTVSNHLNDGGTTIYYGIGYQLIDWKIIDEDEINAVKIGKEVNLFHHIHPISEGPNIDLETVKE